MAITLLVIDVDTSGLDLEILIEFNHIIYIYIATCILRPEIFGNDWLRHAVSTVAIFVYQNMHLHIDNQH